MKKSDLKTGMVVEDATGDYGTVFLNTDAGEYGQRLRDVIVFENELWAELSAYEDDLTSEQLPPIMRVFRRRSVTYLLSNDLRYLVLVWERPEELFRIKTKLSILEVEDQRYLIYDKRKDKYVLDKMSNNSAHFKTEFTKKEVNQIDFDNSVFKVEEAVF